VGETECACLHPLTIPIPPLHPSHPSPSSLLSHSREWDRWALMATIGVTVGLLGWALKALIATLAGARIRAVASVAAAHGALPAFLLGVLWSGALAAVAAWPVYAIAPQAAGAGVAEVMAYLNGCVVPKVGTG